MRRRRLRLRRSAAASSGVAKEKWRMGRKVGGGWWWYGLVRVLARFWRNEGFERAICNAIQLLVAGLKEKVRLQI